MPLPWSQTQSSNKSELLQVLSQRMLFCLISVLFLFLCLFSSLFGAIFNFFGTSTVLSSIAKFEMNMMCFVEKYTLGSFSRHLGMSYSAISVGSEFDVNVTVAYMPQTKHKVRVCIHQLMEMLWSEYKNLTQYFTYVQVVQNSQQPYRTQTMMNNENQLQLGNMY